jgi:hypothetical protein
LGDTRGNRPLPKIRVHYPVSACAFELTRCVAGNIVTVHAGFAYINALTKLPCIKLLVSLGDASTLLIRVLNLLRTRRKAECCRQQNNEASQLHGAVSGLPTTKRRGRQIVPALIIRVLSFDAAAYLTHADKLAKNDHHNDHHDSRQCESSNSGAISQSAWRNVARVLVVHGECIIGI